MAPHSLFAQGQERGDAQAMHLMQPGTGPMRQGNIVEAEKYFTQATVAAPQFADVFLDLG
jgi:hypothetical protein